jgi:hypothetical protein
MAGIFKNQRPRAKVDAIKLLDQFEYHDIKSTKHVDKNETTTPWEHRPDDFSLSSMSPTRIAGEVDKEKGKPNSYFTQCHYTADKCVLSTQLRTPRGRYEEHSSKFPSVVKPRFIEQVGESQTSEGDAC